MNLFIIGNGFDIYHGLNTSYGSFYDYLRAHDWDIFAISCSLFIDQYDKKEMLWSRYEESLAVFDYNRFTITLDLLDSDNKRIILAGIPEIEENIEIWKERLDAAFMNWIISMQNGTVRSNQHFHPEDIFLNFNYTDTLQNIYGVDFNQILYIHNCTRDNKLIYGHGENFDFRERLASYGLLDGEDIVYSDYVQIRDVCILCTLGTALQKDVKAIIEKNRAFCERLVGIENVVVIGHSMNDIDIPYFEWIRDNISHDAKWTISFYQDSAPIEKQVQKLNLNNYELATAETILERFLMK